MELVPMSSLFKLQTHPYQFLLYTEWLMLGSCGFLAIIEFVQNPHFPLQHFLVLILLGLMGIFLPTENTAHKILYCALEIGLIFYGTSLGYLHIMPSLYLVAVIRSCFLFKFTVPWIMAGLSFVLHIKHQIQYLQTFDIQTLSPSLQQSLWLHQFGSVLMFGLALFFVVKLVYALLADQRRREELAEMNKQLQEYALKIEDMAAIQERNRIARDIHDSLGHVLSALNIQLQTAVRLWHKDLNQSRQFLIQSKQLGEEAIREVRRSVGTLRADSGKEKSLKIAIESLVKEFCQGTGIPVSTQIDLDTIPSSQVVKTLYRIAQEALTNICKYAHATKVQLQIKTTSDQVCLTVEDNGQGFTANSMIKGFGLQGMRERTDALKGSFQVDTHPGQGCRIMVRLPI